MTEVRFTLKNRVSNQRWGTYVRAANAFDGHFVLENGIDMGIGHWRYVQKVVFEFNRVLDSVPERRVP